MKATDFECRHQTLLHLLLVGLAVLTYARYPDDIVSALVRRHSDSASWERLICGTGALLLLGSAALETWANAHDDRYPQLLARILLVLAVGQLLSPAFSRAGKQRSGAGRWGPAFRAAASKWGLALSMIVFAWTLRDRIAEIGAAASLVLWLILNVRRRSAVGF
jgi:hypothetical protein